MDGGYIETASGDGEYIETASGGEAYIETASGRKEEWGIHSDNFWEGEGVYKVTASGGGPTSWLMSPNRQRYMKSAVRFLVNSPGARLAIAVYLVSV